tara:strand:+ start:594 stop:1235 length:642 start_codon:yes stop_codon:yes gene_type:complete
MEVKIKKDGKIKNFKLISKWSDVSYSTWLKLIDFQNGTKTEEAKETIAALSNIPKDLIKQLELSDIVNIMNKVSELQQEQDNTLKRIIEVEGKRYGFMPDLNSITLGEWSDIETFIKKDIEKNLPEVMAVLYRPITEEKNNIYSIAAYDGDIRMRTEEMKKMSAEQVQAALFFFYNLGKAFSETLPLYLMEKLKVTNQQLPQNHSRKNGDTLA